MSEATEPGWWQASDGQWYPPDQHPDPSHRAQFAGAADTTVTRPAAPAPIPTFTAAPSPVGAPPGPSAGVLAPKPAPKRMGGRIAVVLGAVAVIGVGVASYLLAGGGGDDDETADTTEQSSDSGDDGDDGDDSDDGDDAADDLVEVSVDAGNDTLAFLLPPGWVDIAPGSGVSGAERFPDDPELAEVFDANVLVADEQGAILFALDTDLEDQSFVRVLFSPTSGADGFETAIAGGRGVLVGDAGVRLETDEPIDLAASTGHLFRYAIDLGEQDLINIQVIVPTEGGIYVLVAQSTDPTTIDEIVNLAASLEVS